MLFLTFFKNKNSTLSVPTFRCQIKHLYLSHYSHSKCIQGYFTVSMLCKLPMYLFTYLHTYLEKWML